MLMIVVVDRCWSFVESISWSIGLIGWLTVGWLVDQLPSLSFGWSTQSRWLIARCCCWFVTLLIDWLVDWLPRLDWTQIGPSSQLVRISIDCMSSVGCPSWPSSCCWSDWTDQLGWLIDWVDWSLINPRSLIGVDRWSVDSQTLIVRLSLIDQLTVDSIVGLPSYPIGWGWTQTQLTCPGYQFSWVDCPDVRSFSCPVGRLDPVDRPRSVDRIVSFVDGLYPADCWPRSISWTQLGWFGPHGSQFPVGPSSRITQFDPRSVIVDGWLVTQDSIDQFPVTQFPVDWRIQLTSWWVDLPRSRSRLTDQLIDCRCSVDELVLIGPRQMRFSPPRLTVAQFPDRMSWSFVRSFCCWSILWYCYQCVGDDGVVDWSIWCQLSDDVDDQSIWWWTQLLGWLLIVDQSLIIPDWCCWCWWLPR